MRYFGVDECLTISLRWMHFPRPGAGDSSGVGRVGLSWSSWCVSDNAGCDAAPALLLDSPGGRGRGHHSLGYFRITTWFMLYVLLSEMLSRTLVKKTEDAKEDNHQIDFFIIHQYKCAKLVTDITSRCQMSPVQCPRIMSARPWVTPSPDMMTPNGARELVHILRCHTCDDCFPDTPAASPSGGPSYMSCHNVISMNQHTYISLEHWMM